MTLNYTDVYNISFSGLTAAEENAVHTALTELKATTDGQALMQEILDVNLNSVNLEVGRGIGGSSWEPLNNTVYIDLNQIGPTGYYGTDGRLNHYTLQRMIVHESYHVTDPYLLDSLEDREGRAIQFTNEYMAEYYGQDRRILYSDESYSGSAPLLATGFNAAGTSNNYIGLAGEGISDLLTNIGDDELQNNSDNYFYKVIADGNGFAASDTTTTDFLKATDGVVGSSRGGGNVLDTANTKVIYGFTGNDTIDVIGDERIVYGGSGNDRILGDGDDSTLNGGADDDEISDTGGSDSINGGDGTDEIIFIGAFGSDTVTAGESIIIDGDTITGDESGFTFTQSGGLLIEDGAGNSIQLTDWTQDGDYGITLAPNQPPVLANLLTNWNGTDGVALSIVVPADTFSDPENDPLTYSASNMPGWLSFDGTTRTFSGTPTAEGTHYITVTASDAVSGGIASDIFRLEVDGGNSNDGADSSDVGEDSTPSEPVAVQASAWVKYEYSFITTYDGPSSQSNPNVNDNQYRSDNTVVQNGGTATVGDLVFLKDSIGNQDASPSDWNWSNPFDDTWTGSEWTYDITLHYYEVTDIVTDANFTPSTLSGGSNWFDTGYFTYTDTYMEPITYVETGYVWKYETASIVDADNNGYDDRGLTDNPAPYINGTEGADQLTGGESKDRLVGNGGSDSLFGGADNDTLEGGAGDDTLNGGSGNDQVSYAFSNHAVNASLLINSVSNTSGEQDTLISIEHISASTFDDTLISGNGTSAFRGGDGADEFVISEADNATVLIEDFDSVNDSDVIDLSAFEFESINDISISTYNLHNTLIDLGNGQTIHLLNHNTADLAESDFIFASSQGQTITGVEYVAPTATAVSEYDGAVNFQTADYDGDGDLEYTKLDSDNKVHVHDGSNWNYVANYDGAIEYQFVNVDSNSDSEFYGTYSDGTMWRLGHEGAGGWERMWGYENTEKFQIIDSDDDGTYELYGYYTDDNLFLHDPGTGWEFQAWLPGIVDFQVIDYDDDGGLDTAILFGEAAKELWLMNDEGHWQELPSYHGYDDFQFIDENGDGELEFYGRSGNTVDYIADSSAIGADILVGTAGDDRVIGLSGNDTMTGGAGADTFAFGTGFHNDRITDFTIGEDVLEFTPVPGIATAQDVVNSIVYHSNNAIITIPDEGLVTLEGITSGITASDIVVI